MMWMDDRKGDNETHEIETDDYNAWRYIDGHIDCEVSD